MSIAPNYTRHGQLIEIGLGACTCTLNPPELVGKYAGTIPCPTCNATGRGKRGAPNGCKTCHGAKTTYSLRPEHLITCPRCQGSLKVQGSLYDNLDHEIWRSLPFEVARQDRAISWNEAYLGRGRAWSCEDYGTRWHWGDEQLIAEVRYGSDARSIQGINYILPLNREATLGLLADKIVIILTRGGYSVAGYWEGGPDVAAQAARELSVEAGRIFGAQVYEAGGNGTLAAASYLKED